MEAIWVSKTVWCSASFGLRLSWMISHRPDGVNGDNTFKDFWWMIQVHWLTWTWVSRSILSILHGLPFTNPEGSMTLPNMLDGCESNIWALLHPTGMAKQTATWSNGSGRLVCTHIASMPWPKKPAIFKSWSTDGTSKRHISMRSPMSTRNLPFDWTLSRFAS